MAARATAQEVTRQFSQGVVGAGSTTRDWIRVQRGGSMAGEATERTYVWRKFTLPPGQCQHYELTQFISNPYGFVADCGFLPKSGVEEEISGNPDRASRGPRAEEQAGNVNKGLRNLGGFRMQERATGSRGKVLKHTRIALSTNR